jgi:hypothetical protein
MRKMLLLAATVAMALSFSAGHADQTNACVAQDATGVVTQGALSCHYTSTVATGRIIQATPNQVHVDVKLPSGTTVKDAYSQDSLTPPGQGSFSTPVGSIVTVTVGPDTAAGPVSGAIGLVIIGDAS